MSHRFENFTPVLVHSMGGEDGCDIFGYAQARGHWFDDGRYWVCVGISEHDEIQPAVYSYSHVFGEQRHSMYGSVIHVPGGKEFAKQVLASVGMPEIMLDALTCTPDAEWYPDLAGGYSDEIGMVVPGAYSWAMMEFKHGLNWMHTWAQENLTREYMGAWGVPEKMYAIPRDLRHAVEPLKWYFGADTPDMSTQNGQVQMPPIAGERTFVAMKPICEIERDPADGLPWVGSVMLCHHGRLARMYVELPYRSHVWEPSHIMDARDGTVVWSSDGGYAWSGSYHALVGCECSRCLEERAWDADTDWEQVWAEETGSDSIDEFADMDEQEAFDHIMNLAGTDDIGVLDDFCTQAAERAVAELKAEELAWEIFNLRSEVSDLEMIIRQAQDDIATWRAQRREFNDRLMAIIAGASAQEELDWSGISHMVDALERAD